MIKNLLLILVLSISFTSADGERDFCDLKNENQVLKLKLKVHDLKEQISELKQTLQEINGGEKKLQRVKAIKKLKRELRESREISLNIGAT